MADYRAPIEDMRFLIDELLDVETSLGAAMAIAAQGTEEQKQGWITPRAGGGNRLKIGSY